MSVSSSNSAPAQAGFSWQRVWKLFDRHRPAVAIVMALVLATSILGVVNPLLIQVVFDDALFPSDGGVDVSLLVVLSVVMIVIAIAGGALGVYQTLVTNLLGQHVLRDLRARVYRHLQVPVLSF